MQKRICIFEDQGYLNLLPLVYFRAAYELRCGINLLMEKIIRQYPNAQVTLFARDYLAPVLKERTSYAVNEAINEDCLFINGRLLAASSIKVSGKEEVGIKDGSIAYAFLKKENVSLITPQVLLEGSALDALKNKVDTKDIDAELINFSWDLIHHNPAQIGKDFEALVGKGAVKGKVYKGACLVEESRIFIDEGAEVKAGAVIDAEEGPVYIGKGATICVNATVEGPGFIGNKAKVNIGGKVREGTSVGEVSKVGGEIEESILHSYSNKQHDGFLGHAYLGMWVNLGAGTSNSDLKNNYGNVKVWVNGKMRDSGSMFVGLTMGDHSKAALNTMFNTGTVVGVCSNVFGAGFPPKFVPSFAWGGPGNMVTYKLEKGLEVSKKVMGRRKLEMSPAEEKLFHKVFELTAGERKAAGIKE